MGVILMRPLTSGVFQHLMAEAFPDIDAASEGGWSGPAAAQLCALGSVRGRGVGGDVGEVHAVVGGDLPLVGDGRSPGGGTGGALSPDQSGVCEGG